MMLWSGIFQHHISMYIHTHTCAHDDVVIMCVPNMYSICMYICIYIYIYSYFHISWFASRYDDVVTTYVPAPCMLAEPVVMYMSIYMSTCMCMEVCIFNSTCVHTCIHCDYACMRHSGMYVSFMDANVCRLAKSMCQFVCVHGMCAYVCMCVYIVWRWCMGAYTHMSMHCMHV
jgi:hypothetical protein